MSRALMVIDGHSLMYRAFYAMPLMNDHQGRFTNAVFGFMTMLLDAAAKYEPDHMAVAFDLHAPTFRHKLYDEYKAGRKPMPEELRPQFDLLREVLRAAGIAVVELEGYEADDMLGTLSRMAEEAGMPSVLLTGDRDALQLVSDLTRVCITRRGVSEMDEYDPVQLQARYGLEAAQITDLKGLMGDSSDHIPGIPGVGEKTALSLLSRYGTVETLLAHSDELKGKQKEKVQTYGQQALFSKQLATIERHVPLTLTLEDTAIAPFEQTALAAALLSLDMRKLAARVGSAAQAPAQREPVRIETPEALTALLKGLTGKVAMALTDSLSLAWEDGCAVVALRQDLLSPGMDWREVMVQLSAVDPGIRWILHDGKQWMHQFKAQGLALSAPVFDTYLAAYLLSVGDSRYTLESVMAAVLNRPMAPCAAEDIRLAAREMGRQLEEKGMTALFHDMEMPLIQVLFAMEQEGFRVDREKLAALGEQMQDQLASLETEIYRRAGHSFNIQSPKQLGEVLFDEMRLPVIRKTKSGYATDIAVLEALQDEDPIIEAIMNYRKLAKLRGTYVDGLIPLMDSENRLHTHFHQTGTVTGRLSSSDPNLQNIPVRQAEGRQIRELFVASDSDHVLVDADYSQIELRVMAHMADDARMIQAFRDGGDIHAKTAAEVFGLKQDEVPPALRSAAKAVNFGIIYGISDFGLSRQLGCSRAEAAEYIEKYLNTYEGVRAFMHTAVEEGRKQGYVKTLFGRRRPMPDLFSSRYNVRMAAERMAMNAPIQGTAADLMKLAMIAVYRALKEGGYEAKLILQVHDELIVDAPRQEADAVAALLQSCMSGVAALKVPLVVDVHQGDNWNAAK